MNYQTDSFKVIWHPYVIDVLGKLVCRPLLLASHCCEIEFMNWVAVEGGLVSIN